MRWVMDVCPFRLLNGRIARDSARASSSVCLKRFEPLFCFLCGWLFRGVGADRVGAAPLPRGGAKKLLLLTEGAWFWAGEAGPELAEALDEDAMAGGLLDMTPS
jgi:hypothetical protein